MKPKKPTHSSWERSPREAEAAEQMKARMSDILLADPDVWWHPGRELVAISTVERSPGGPLWHVSISRPDAKSPTDGHVSFVRSGFGMEDAYEDNSRSTGSPVRHLWLDVPKD